MGQTDRSTLYYIVLFSFEAIGTALHLIVNNFANGSFLVACGGIFIAIMVSGKVSGAHFHSGLTIGRYIIDGEHKRNLKHFIVMLLAQYIGGYIGQWYSYLELNEDILDIKPPSPDYSMWFVLSAEIFFSLIMGTAIFITMYSQVNLSKDMFVNAVGGCIGIYFCLNAAQPLSGAGLNPTIGFINPTFNAIVRDSTNLKFTICYFIGPIIGSILGALFLKYVMIANTPQHQKHKRITITTQRSDQFSKSQDSMIQQQREGMSEVYKRLLLDDKSEKESDITKGQGFGDLKENQDNQ